MVDRTNSNTTFKTGEQNFRNSEREGAMTAMLVTVTVPTRGEALAFARSLVEARLADSDACPCVAALPIVEGNPDRFE